MSDGGKGSRPRPYSVSQEKFGSNYDQIFRKKPENDSTNKTTENNSPKDSK